MCAIVSIWLSDILLGVALRADYAEGLGYLLGMYCLVMFPCGGALLGALPAALLGALRSGHDSQFNPLLPLLTGAVVAFFVTLAASVGAVFLFSQ